MTLKVVGTADVDDDVPEVDVPEVVVPVEVPDVLVPVLVEPLVVTVDVPVPEVDVLVEVPEVLVREELTLGVEVVPDVGVNEATVEKIVETLPSGLVIV